MAPAGQTYYKVFTGKDAIFYPGSKTQHRRHHRRHLEHDHDRRGRRAGHLDEAGRHPVRPARSTRRRWRCPGQTGINIGMADGSVRWIDLSTTHPPKARGRDHPRRRRSDRLSTTDDGPGEAVPFLVPKAVPIPTKPAPPKRSRV